MSYLNSLKNAKIEVESERVKLRTAEARNKELERDLSMEKELVEELQKELEKEKSSLQQEIEKTSFLQQELHQKNIEFGEMQHLLQAKESDLVEAKLDIQNLKSEQASLQLILEDKDLQLFDARKNLDEVNQEVAELRMLMSSKEEQLVQATTMIKEKEEHVQVMQDELNNTRVKVSEAESVVERIVELTNELVISIKDQNELRQSNNMTLEFFQQPLDELSDDFRLQKKQYETELKFSRESLRVKEMEVLAAKRALAIKDEELKTVLERLDTKEKELRKLKEEAVEDANDLRKLYSLAQERIGESSVGDLAIEKLKLEAAQLEVEAATSALQKLAEMSRELLNKASLSIEADADIFMPNGSGPGLVLLENNECFKEVKTEVARLSSLTEQLLQDAGITVGAD
jgi:DNA repair exonuclease SbcCD ATPase subunit